MKYGIMVQTMEIKPDMKDATRDEMSQAMTVGLNQIVQKASKGVSSLPDGKEGNLLSHCITRVGCHLVVSFLFGYQS